MSPGVHPPTGQYFFRLDGFTPIACHHAGTTDNDPPCSPGPRGRRTSSMTITSVPGVGMPIESAPDRASMGNGSLHGGQVARRREFGHPVGTADRCGRTLGESFHHRGRDRRATGIEPVEACEMRAGRIPSVHQSDEYGDRSDDKGRPVFEKCVQHNLRLEAIGEDCAAPAERRRAFAPRIPSREIAVPRQICATLNGARMFRR